MNLLVSIIYLTKNGGPLFEESLKAVFSQKSSYEYEVIAVDSGSTDGTIEILKRYPMRVYQIRPEEFNFGLTRDYGFSLAKGEILISLSQDAVPVGPDWFNNMVSPFFEDESVAVVQGMDVLPVNQDLFYWEKIRKFYFTRESRKWIRTHDGIGLSFTSCAIRRKVWEENPIGHIEMNEDKLFQKKITDKGYKIIFNREAMDYHSHMYNLRGLAKRCENEGLGWRAVEQEYSLLDMLLDIGNPVIFAAFLYGVGTFQIKRLAEVLFPIIRPVYVYKGNHFSRSYIR